MGFEGGWEGGGGVLHPPNTAAAASLPRVYKLV